MGIVITSLIRKYYTLYTKKKVQKTEFKLNRRLVAFLNPDYGIKLNAYAMFFLSVCQCFSSSQFRLAVDEYDLLKKIKFTLLKLIKIDSDIRLVQGKDMVYAIMRVLSRCIKKGYLQQMIDLNLLYHIKEGGFVVENRIDLVNSMRKKLQLFARAISQADGTQ